MKIIKLSDKNKKETPHNADVLKMYDEKSAQAVHITLQAGEALKPHITQVDVFFYVLEGTPTIQVGYQKEEVDKDCLVESPKNIVHCIYNFSISISRILVVKAPKPTSRSKLL